MITASTVRILVATLAAATAMAVVGAPSALAADSSPCGPQVFAAWSSDKVQECPLTSALAPNGWVPVYAQPVAVAAGRMPPNPAGWLHGVSDQYFVCDRSVASADYHHPSAGTHSTWWAYTQADGSNAWGWVPEVFFKGGGTNEPDAGLRRCPSTPAPSTPAQPVAPRPPVASPPSPPTSTPSAATPVAPDLSCTPEPAVIGGAATLDAGSFLVPRRSRQKPRAPVGRLTVDYGRLTRVTGVLRDAAGAPIAGAPICLVSRPDDQTGPFLPFERTTTAADGSYTVTMTAGFSREVVAIYRSGSFAIVGRTTVKVKPKLVARPHKRSLRNGQLLVITGRLSGGPYPKRGVTLNLQAVREGRWQGFADPFRSDTDGRFRFRYRFTRTVGVQQYKMRIRAGAQAGYPYVSGYSQAIKIRVAG